MAENRDIKINGIQLSSMGVTLESGAYSAFRTSPQLKDFVCNDDPTSPGIEVITEFPDGKSASVIKEREITLTFLIEGNDVDDFSAKYDAFVSMLLKGSVVLTVPELGKGYRLIYRNCTQYDNYLLKACRMAVKFLEPNPADNIDEI